jgi:hypothetical protein
MQGRIRRAVIGAAMVAVVGVGPAVMSTTSASAWFRGNQGCTPGYWKNHTDAWADTAYSPTDTVGSVFTLPPDLSSFNNESLLDALNGQGGPDLSGATEILLRAAVAGILNATDTNVQYPTTAAKIINHVNVALKSEDRDRILALATKIDNFNNGVGGCPLS